MTDTFTDFDVIDHKDLRVVEKLLEIKKIRMSFAIDHHVNTRGEKLNFTHYPHIRELYETVARDIVLQGSVQSMKAQPLDAKVHTPTGWKKMGDLQVGDLVSTPDGKNAPIIAIQPQGKVRIYKITLSDGRTVEACGDHLWKVRWCKKRFEGSCGVMYHLHDIKILSTNEIIHYMRDDECNAFLVPICDPEKSDLFYQCVDIIDFIGKKSAQCIVIDHPDQLYITDNYIVTHNSEWAIVDHFAAAYTGISIFFVVPKYETRTTYVQNRVNKCVENVPEYKKIIGVGFFDSVALKSFGKGTIKYTGSNVLADFREYPADMIIIDEVDECNQDNIEYALDRLRASPYQFKRYIGNPKFEGKGINHYFKMSDQREWTIPCKECGQYSEIDWFETVVKEILDREGNVVDYRLRDTEWHEGCGRDVFMICPLCGGELHRGSFNGKWIIKQPENAVTGYHISMMCSLVNSISGMWNRFQKAANDPARMQQFYNSDLGLPYSAVGNRVTESILDNCVGDYNLVLKPDCAHIVDDEHIGPCSMGIDVGGNFDVRVSYIEARGKRKLVYIGKVKNIDELHSIIERYNVEKCVVDSMPESVLVQEFQEEAACDVWLCSYRKAEGTDRRMSYDSNHRMITVDRTEALDRSFAQLRKGFNILPKNYGAVLDGAYLSEMCMPVRKISSDDKGRQFCEWTRGKDHQRHCDTYDMLAAIMITESIIDEIMVG